MASADVFTIGSLPNAIDDESKLVLAERLLREGFLSRGGPGEHDAVTVVDAR